MAGWRIHFSLRLRSRGIIIICINLEQMARTEKREDAREAEAGATLGRIEGD